MEVEVTLIICSEQPQIIADRIAALRSIGANLLQPENDQSIHDRYFDTSDGALQRRRFALRIREIDKQFYITLKGKSTPSKSGVGVERLEIELNWSKEGLETILKELSNQKITVIQEPVELHDDTLPWERLSEYGFVPIQDRETFRMVRNIVSNEEPVSPLAELAIDRGTFHYDSQEVNYYEIEIELKGKGTSTTLRSIVDDLFSIFGNELRIWRHSKLATGKAIAQILKQDQLKNMIDERGYLRPCALRRLESLLSKNEENYIDLTS